MSSDRLNDGDVLAMNGTSAALGEVYAKLGYTEAKDLAFFMATDYVTSPTQVPGKIIFGVGVGALTVLIRLKGGYPEGVCYAILLMNPLSPALNRWFKPKRFAPEPEEGA